MIASSSAFRGLSSAFPGEEVALEDGVSAVEQGGRVEEVVGGVGVLEGVDVVEPVGFKGFEEVEPVGFEGVKEVELVCLEGVGVGGTGVMRAEVRLG